MTRLAEKEELFRSGKLAATLQLSNESIGSAELVKLTPEFRTLLFERCSAMSSEVIAAAQSSFIGAHSYMNNFGYLRSGVFIGRFCSIGRRVTLGAGGHWMSGVSTSPFLSGGPAHRNYTARQLEEIDLRNDASDTFQTIIQSDVWIGDGAIVRPGVTIGVGAVVGANSVVTRDVAPFEVVGGVPSKHIRSRFPVEVSEKLLQSEWWEYPLQTLEALNTGNVFKFLDDLKALQQIPPTYETYSFQD